VSAGAKTRPQPHPRAAELIARRSQASAPRPGVSGTVARRPLAENFKRGMEPRGVPIQYTENQALTPGELAFVHYYIGICRFNAVDAMRRCIDQGDVETRDMNQASPLAYANMSKPHVLRAIQQAMDVRAKKLELSSERILEEIMKVAFLDPLDVLDENGNIKNLADIPEDARKAIAAFDFENSKWSNRKSVKFIDKLAALQLLGRHLKLFKDQLEVTVSYEELVRQSIAEEEKQKKLEAEKQAAAKALPPKASEQVVEVGEPPNPDMDLSSIRDQE
jgi:phage terminase small subunit